MLICYKPMGKNDKERGDNVAEKNVKSWILNGNMKKIYSVFEAFDCLMIELYE